MRRRALITGITGQDGSFLAELLLEKDYEVWGLVRRASNFNTQRIEHLYQDPHAPSGRLHLVYGDITDDSALLRALTEVGPGAEIYHLAAQSHVRVSFDLPTITAEATALGAGRLFELVRTLGSEYRTGCKIYNAASSELFGNQPPPQSERTPIDPQSPYAASKAYAYHMARLYRQAYGMFIVNGILFNHDSERRSETFVTRKVTRAVGRIACGLQDKLYLGNLEARRDWGFAGDYVAGMWSMLQQGKPDDYVLATGKSYPVRLMVEYAFSRLGLNSAEHVVYDARYERPAEVHFLCGDARKAEAAFGWTPHVNFTALLDRMVDHDRALAEREQRERGR